MKSPLLARLTLIGLAGFFAGGIIHIFVIFSIPSFVPDVAYERIGRLGATEGFVRLASVTAGAEPLPMLDPAMAHAACRYELADGPVRLDAEIDAPFWSFALFNRRGETIYSFNDRTSGTGKLGMLVLTPEQLSVLREQPPADLEDLIVIETDEEDGFALLRAFVPNDLRRQTIEASLDAARCAPL
ncbi:hypothetical protein H2509_18085 [Stappia sp. F7233]|uniref:DUF1254 domain-containing protein n=1 Tax=Stappia albiluteola TaxID=2758565 RepID=A0A839AJF7_9HYPH|nr:DUF1254 domain-containing protein [Stappia albiluteola]MBA5779042.1 hypothetical protein [Stappia albiluteola]